MSAGRLSLEGRRSRQGTGGWRRTVRLAASRLLSGAGGAAFAVALSLPVSAGAQRSTPWLPRLRIENDSYNFWLMPGQRTDEEYTNGVVASLETLRGAWWGKHFGGGHPGCAASSSPHGTCLTTVVSLSQDIYTPDLHRPPFANPDWRNERPYAGWLALTGEGRRVSPRQLRTMSLAIGVTGEPSLAEAMQDVFHHITAQWTIPAKGWETQVGFEPGLIAGWRHDLLAVRVAPGGVGVLDFAPFYGVSLGNILTQGEAGGKLRAGMNLSHPWDPRTWRQRAPAELFVSLGGRAAYVAHNFSLDGTLVNPDRKVERRPLIYEHEIGIGARVKRLSFGWRTTTRSREYETGPLHFTWSAMYAGIEFYK